MKVSVIVPTYNEKRVILDCLESLGKQSLGDFEIIVVDDGSTDGTKKEIGNLHKVVPSIKLLTQSHKGPGAARNLGAKKAKGKILVFVDADMAFDKDFLKKLVAPIKKGKVSGTFSKEEYVSNWQNALSRSWSINEGWQQKRRHPKDYPDTQPVFRAILKKEFEKVGGFTPGGYTDDWSLSKKLGYEAVNAPGAKFFHKNPESLDETYIQAKWVAKRKYKFGLLGSLVALVRVFFPISLVVGLVKGTLHKEPTFLIFKIVYDFGCFMGIIEYLTTGKGIK